MIGNRSALHLAFRSLEAVRELLEEIFDNTLVVVAPAENVVQRRKTVGLAGFLLVVELLGIELMISDYAPVVARGVHREAGRECTIDPDDH